MTKKPPDDLVKIHELQAMGGTAYLPLHELIPRIAADIGVIPKDRKSQGYGDSYAYQGIDDIIAKAKFVLHRYGVFYYPEHISTVTEPVTSKGGAHGVRVRARYRWHWVGPNGDTLATPPVVEGEAIDYGDKAMRKVQTSSKKAMLIDMLAIAAEEGHDTDAGSQAVAVPLPDVPTVAAANAVKTAIYDRAAEKAPSIETPEERTALASEAYQILVVDTGLEEPAGMLSLEARDHALRQVADDAFVTALFEAAAERMPL